jgi:hypothetical protein
MGKDLGQCIRTAGRAEAHIYRCKTTFFLILSSKRFSMSQFLTGENVSPIRTGIHSPVNTKQLLIEMSRDMASAQDIVADDTPVD